jgi:Domain of unknown function (DUF4124)
MRLLIVLLILITSNASAEIYKTTNPDGSTSYSDVETPGSKTIIPPKLTTTPAVKATKKVPVEPVVADEEALPYLTFLISAPADQSIIIGNNGNVKLSLSIEPALQKEFQHSITILVNGQPIKTGLTTLITQLSDLDRGAHTFTAQILSKGKKVLKTTQGVTIHIKRHSILHKKGNLP